MKFSKTLCLAIAMVMLASLAHARGGKSGGGKGKSGRGYYSYYSNNYIPSTIPPVEIYDKKQLLEKIMNGQADAIREVTQRIAKSGSYIDGIAYLGTLPGFKEEAIFASVWMKKTDIEILNKLVPGAYEAGIAQYRKNQKTRDNVFGLILVLGIIGFVWWMRSTPKTKHHNTYIKTSETVKTIVNGRTTQYVYDDRKQNTNPKTVVRGKTTFYVYD